MSQTEGYKNVRCANCSRYIDQNNLPHYPESVPVNQRWLCSPKCQKQVAEKGKKKQRTEEALREMNMEDPAESLGLKTEAVKAREALKPKPKAAEPEEEDDLVSLPGDSHPQGLVMAAAKVLEGAALLAQQDFLIVTGLAQEMIDTAQDKIAQHLAESSDGKQGL